MRTQYPPIVDGSFVVTAGDAYPADPPDIRHARQRAGGAVLLGWLVPALPVAVSPFYLALAEGLAVAIGLLAGVIPARRAAGLEPVQALRAE